MPKEKKKVYNNITRELAEEAMSKFAQSANAISNLEARMNEDLQKIRDRYQDDLNRHNASKDEQVNILEAWAYENKDSWGKAKSQELLHGSLGFRTGTPKVKFDRGFNTKSVTALLKEHYPQYVRVVDDLNKEQLIADRDEDFFEKVAAKAHIQVVQEETFFVTSKEEVLQH